jgi:hypothetical protein
MGNTCNQAAIGRGASILTYHWQPQMIQANC